ncbi:MAG: hypothetical protein JXR75_05165 [Rhodobacteraceae bacterium]|nr:hypothetical protein [Paracoccaceae bacterium]
MTDDELQMASAATAALFALTFLFGGRVHPMRKIIGDRRIIVSFGAGVSTAYLFVRLMPELAEARETLSAAAATALPLDGMIVYFVAMIGFLLVYGLDHFRRTSDTVAAGTEGEVPGAEARYRAYGMAPYVLLLTYVIVKESAVSMVAMAQYACAIAFHFLAVDHSLRDEMGSVYDARGRFILAAMCVLGWALAATTHVQEWVLALLLAFMSGAVIVNGAVMELPTDRNGRFWSFALGSLMFGLVLMAV